jgi:UDP-glucose:(heptosyl)LPS alpha-1,3-glucosyltransferase
MNPSPGGKGDSLIRGGGPARRLRIAIVSPKFGLFGGAERFAYELTERLSRNDRYEFHVFANRWKEGSGRVVFHRVPAVRFPRSLRPLGFAWFSGRMVSRGRFDLVHTHERVFRADVVSIHFVPHADWVRDVRRKRMSLFDRATDYLERRMVENAVRGWHLPVSSITRDTFLARYPVDSARVRVVHPGVDVERFARPDRAACRKEIRGRHGIGESDLVVLFVGMNFEVKGLDRVIAAVAQAGRRTPGTRWSVLVVGRGNERKYRRISREAGIGDSVIFAGPQEDGIEKYYRASDLFMMLSTFDTFGMVVLEAMAAGLPVIVCAEVGARDLVEDGVNGFVVQELRDTGATARALIHLCEDARRAEMAKEAVATAAENDWDAVAEKVLAVYEEALS